VALAEMALGSDMGIVAGTFRGQAPRHAQAFGEDQGRYLLAVSGNDFHYTTGLMRDARIPFFYAARANGVYFEIPNEEPIPLTALRAAHEAWFPQHMER
jgi:phosphoribosylformylglycinamidine synthase